MIRGLILGVVLTLVVLALGAYVGVKAGAMPANADAQPSKLEAWAARTSLRATIHRSAPQGGNPVPAVDQNLLAGVKLYMANCAVCHGAADGKATNVALGLYQRPPQLAVDGVEDDPAGVTYWKIKHGIRLTGMPSYTATLSYQQIWQITALLQHMDHLPPAVDAQWKRSHTAEALAPTAHQQRLRGRRSSGRLTRRSRCCNARQNACGISAPRVTHARTGSNVAIQR